jgi:hypothetical protein
LKSFVSRDLQRQRIDVLDESNRATFRLGHPTRCGASRIGLCVWGAAWYRNWKPAVL